MEPVKKKIWLVNYYAMPPKLESRLRTIKFAHYLTQMGYDVKIFSSSVLHNKNKNLITDNRKYIEVEYDDLKFIHIKTINYNKNGIARFISLFQFHFKLFILRNKFQKPDIIIHTALPPFGNILYYAALRLRAEYIVEVLDLWPESFVSFGLISKRNPVLKLAYFLEKWLYIKADKVVFSMEGGKDYITDKKWDNGNGNKIDLSKIHYINNGVDIMDFDFYKSTYKLDDIDLSRNDTFKIVYLGSIRLANNLKKLIDAANLLQSNEKIIFLIYGDGDDRKFLEDYCMDKKIRNVIFKQKWIDPKFVPYVLSQSSLNILNYKPNEIEKYGGSQSKFFQYLASGKPVCSNLNQGYCLINKYNLGLANNYNSDEEYANAILSIAEMDSKSYNEICKRSRMVSEEFDYKLLTEKLVDIF